MAKTPNQKLRSERLRRGWRQSDLADRLQAMAADRGLPELGVDSTTVSRWERGMVPQPYYAHLLCAVFELSPETLGLPRFLVKPESPQPLAPTGAEHGSLSLLGSAAAPTTLELVRRFSMSSMDAASLDHVEESVHRLARAYSTTPPAQLLPQVQLRLAQVDEVLDHRLTLPQHSRLLVAAGWLHLLLAALHFDLGQREAAHVSRDAAMYAAEQAHDADIAGWAFETPAWFALFEGRPLDAIDFAQEGRRVSSDASSAHVMNSLKIAIAFAQLGDRMAAERALEEAASEVAAMPPPPHPDHHFVFDPPKFNYYAGTAYAWLKVPALVEEHAREVVRQSSNPRWRSWVPTRVAMARLDLAHALLQQNRLDEAVFEGIQAFDAFVRHDTILRATQLGQVLRATYPRARETADFHERLVLERRELYALELPASD